MVIKFSDHIDDKSVEYAYLYLLGREAENDDVIALHASQQRTVAQLIQSATESDEYQARLKVMLKNANSTHGDRFFNLQLNGPLEKRAVLFLGTCVVQWLAETASRIGWDAAHHLWQSTPISKIPDLDITAYDAVVVHLTLRHILFNTAIDLSGSIDGDLFYLAFDYDSFLTAAKNKLKVIVERLVQEISSASPVFLLSFPEPPSTYLSLLRPRGQKSMYHLIRELNDYMATFLNELDGAYLLEINDLRTSLGDNDFSDYYHNAFSHSGFEGGNVETIRESILNRLNVMLDILSNQAPIKAIITDLDNTLWKGVLAEMDEIIASEHIEGWPLGYAEALLICKQRGVLLAICSKNDDAQTRKNFDSVWQGRLRLDDFASIRINWSPKSQNIAEILSELNILPEHALFIDDNPLEIAEVQRAFPSMRTLTGDPDKWRMNLLYSAPLQVAKISEEAVRRTDLIRAKIERQKLAGTTDREGYLRDLQLRVDIRTLANSEDRHFDRALELLNRTNQFNTTGKRWTASELQGFMAEGGTVYILRAADRFADHGLVAVALLRGDCLVQMVLSCRVFGLELEDALLAQVLVDHPTAGVLQAEWQETGRNATAQQFLERHFYLESETWQLRKKPAWAEHINFSVA